MCLLSCNCQRPTFLTASGKVEREERVKVSSKASTSSIAFHAGSKEPFASGCTESATDISTSSNWENAKISICFFYICRNFLLKTHFLFLNFNFILLRGFSDVRYGLHRFLSSIICQRKKRRAQVSQKFTPGVRWWFFSLLFCSKDRETNE